ncbi:MAG: hypothetical protein AABX53_02935 [Nanoarchaeota archaeon]
MADALLLSVPFLSFLLALLIVPYWIRKAHQIKLVWPDVNKYSKPLVAGSGGAAVVGVFVVSMLIFIAYRVFYLHSSSYLVEMFGLLVTLVLLCGIGFMDDLLGWQRGGLSRRSRIILVIVASLPLVVINAGRATMDIPFLGLVDLGLLYPLVLIPLGIVGAATTFNFLAGFNGLEAGQGVLILGSLSLVAYLTGNTWLALLGLCFVMALVAFLVYNFFPSKIFPGDSLTYPIGGMIAMMAILGNFEKIAMFFFMPIMVEVFLKSRGAFIKPSFGKPALDGSLGLLHPRVYGLTHLTLYLQQKIGIKATEKRSVYIIWTFQLVVILLGFFIFREGIFSHVF